MANIYLLRHGKVSGEAALYGHTDVEVETTIDDEIIQQLTALNVEIDAIITSPLKRCINLAKELSKKAQVTVTSIAQLKEMNFGLYDGVPFDQLHQDANTWQLFEKFWQNPVQHPLPNAELLTGFSYRVNNAWQEIVNNIQLAQSNQNIVVVCHGGVIRMILAHLLNIDFRNPRWYTNLSIANGSLTTIEVGKKQVRVKQIAKPLLAIKESIVNPVSTHEFPYCLLRKSQNDHFQEHM